MFVAKGARTKLKNKRKQSFYEEYVRSLLIEAQKLKISKSDLIDMIQRGEEN